MKLQLSLGITANPRTWPIIDGRERIEHAEYHVATGLLPHEAVAKPLLQHGIKANRPVLETVAQYSYERGLTPRRMQLDEVFAASTMEQ